MNDTIRTVFTIAAFCTLFMLIGWLAPSLYAAYSPQSNYIQMHSFEVNDAHTGQETHGICLDRTIKRQASGEVFTELYIVSESGNRTEIRETQRERFFHDGRRVINIEADLPPDIKSGTYHYERVYTMELARGRVTRSFTFRSDNFTISNASTSISDATC